MFIAEGLEFFVAVCLRTPYFVDVADGFLIFIRNIVPIFKGLGVREHLQTLEDEDTIFFRIVNRLASDKISGTDHPGMGVMSQK
jgi:hypothetical protein